MQRWTRAIQHLKTTYRTGIRPEYVKAPDIKWAKKAGYTMRA